MTLETEAEPMGRYTLPNHTGSWMRTGALRRYVWCAGASETLQEEWINTLGERRWKDVSLHIEMLGIETGPKGEVPRPTPEELGYDPEMGPEYPTGAVIIYALIGILLTFGTVTFFVLRHYFGG